MDGNVSSKSFPSMYRGTKIWSIYYFRSTDVRSDDSYITVYC